ncbi:hypothetical protein A5844_002093 [Enterococcus sp. 10A9_DIV0425]|uniref:Uncharacterized protein n=1 Tax=Candidatus Enterococcus wittei TaxID=1987383 RepID=A0A242K0B0_9ENTE|nr:hypothetical protein [Enterococcus sp. 10A9_DIV0425]OTP10393.1 hypothetical protein A5844_002093 [Enterococcus sp. 10A9_DIV0425]
MVKKKQKGYFKKPTQVLNEVEVKKVNRIYKSLLEEMKKRGRKNG